MEPIWPQIQLGSAGRTRERLFGNNWAGLAPLGTRFRRKWSLSITLPGPPCRAVPPVRNLSGAQLHRLNAMAEAEIEFSRTKSRGSVEAVVRLDRAGDLWLDGCFRTVAAGFCEADGLPLRESDVCASGMSNQAWRHCRGAAAAHFTFSPGKGRIELGEIAPFSFVLQWRSFPSRPAGGVVIGIR